MGRIVRRAAPPGPIKDLFDRLHELHRQAGEPSVREISAGGGHRASPTTVHNILRGPRVPKWPLLAAVVTALSGNLTEFKQLWDEALMTERGVVGPHSASAIDQADRPTRIAPQVRSLEIPFRNDKFLGRAAEVEELHTRLSRAAPESPQRRQVLFGAPGVGKTEIVVEYIHRFGDSYDLIWWVNAHDENSIRTALLGLSERINPAKHHDGEMRAISATLESLRLGEQFEQPLLIFDGARAPEMVRTYIPPGHANVIITSHRQDWHSTLRTQGMGIDCWTPAETVMFLTKNMRDTVSDIAALAQAIGHLPLAAEHAVAYQRENQISCMEYIQLLNTDAYALFGHDVDILYNGSVLTSWIAPQRTLGPETLLLFHTLAFLPAEPIARDLLRPPSGIAAMSLFDSLRTLLGDGNKVQQALSELAHSSLAKVSRTTVQLHPIVRAVTSARLSHEAPHDAAALTRAAVLLLSSYRTGRSR